MKRVFLGLLVLGLGLYIWSKNKGGNMPKETPLIPRDVLFENPSRIHVHLSPDGRYLAYLAPHKGVLNIFVQDLESKREAQPYTFDTGRGIAGFRWTYKSGVILYSQDEKGDENWRLYKLDVASKKSEALTEQKKVQAHILALSHKHPERAVVTLNNRNPMYHDVYMLDLETGLLTLMYENNEYINFVCDEDLELRLASKQLEGGGSRYDLHKNGRWIEYRTLPPEDLLTTGALGFDRGGENLYWSDSTTHDRAALVRVNMHTQKKEILFEPQRGGISSVFFHPTEKRPLFLIENYLKPQIHVLDQSMKEHIDYLQEQKMGLFSITGASLDLKKWIVMYYSDTASGEYYVYDSEAKNLQYLFAMKDSLQAYEESMRPRQAIEIKARDGLVLPSYLTRAHSKKGPLVLLVHGGPHSRDSWEFNITDQWLSNRGYHVLRVNYRGSTGLGKGFLNAGNGEWGRKMHDDLVDAVNWAIKKKIADPEKIAIMGGSYGGYATLVGLTMTPDVFACGVDIVGPANLETLLQSVPPYWKPAMEELKLQIGAGYETEHGRTFLRSRSPITFVDRIKKPLLIGHGKNDSRVKQAEADQIVRAMKDRDFPVTYILYPDEGHGFAKPENNKSFFAITEQFLKEYLGGRAEPLGDHLKKSSAQILEGQV